MRCLFIAFIWILSVSFARAQVKGLDSTLQHKFDSINVIWSNIENEFPTWKTGDDNSQLSGLIKNIVTDPFAKHLFSIDPSVSQLHITGFNTINRRVTLDNWLSTLDPNFCPLYPN